MLGLDCWIGPVDIVAVDDLPPDGIVMPVGMVGAPMVATERIWSGDEAWRPCDERTTSWKGE